MLVEVPNDDSKPPLLLPNRLAASPAAAPPLDGLLVGVVLFEVVLLFALGGGPSEAGRAGNALVTGGGVTVEEVDMGSVRNERMCQKME